MLNKLVHKLSRHHHPWRKMKFDELAEVYTSMTLRSLGFSLMGVFVPVYLYKNGVDLPTIFFLFAMFFALRVPLSFLVAKIVGRIGPKHTIAMSTLMMVIFFFLLLSYETLNIPLLFLMLVWTLSNGMFFIATNVDFSKINHAKHGGKELGWLYIFERIGAAAGPVVGGVIATFIAPEATILFALIILIASIVPLLLTNEPVKVHQKVDFSGFKRRPYIRDYISLSGYNITNVVNGLIWPLFLAAFVLIENTYATLGLIVGISMVISLVSARLYGKFIDSKKGSSLLKIGAITNVLLQISRAFVTSAPAATAVTTAGEPINLAMKMPLVKGVFDVADEDDNFRIVYLVWMEAITGIAKAIFCFCLYFASLQFDPFDVLRVSFIALSIASLSVLVQKFPALRKA